LKDWEFDRKRVHLAGRDYGLPSSTRDGHGGHISAMRALWAPMIVQENHFLSSLL
jgi:hypothetical protein